MTRERLASINPWALSFILAGVIVAVMVLSGGTPLRPYVAVAFALVCPGMAIVRLLGIGDSLLEVSVAIALSIAIELLASLVMIYSGVWSPNGLFLCLVGLTLMAAGFDLAGLRIQPEKQP
jgi:hypothetical protein